MKIIQNFKRETRNFIIIALIALILIGLFMIYFSETDISKVLYALASVAIGVLLGMFLATPKYKVPKVEEEKVVQDKQTRKK